MQISHDDIQFAVELALKEVANNAVGDEIRRLKDEPLSIEQLKRIKSQYSDEYTATMIICAVTSAIETYHEQLREKLLEHGIDIGELDTTSTAMRSTYTQYFKNKNEE